MAKNRNKKKRNAVVSMDTTETTTTVSDLPQAMDTSETGLSKPASTSFNIKIKKGRPMKRSKNVRKMKATTKAIAKSEKYVERVTKSESKELRVKSAKSLYD